MKTLLAIGLVILSLPLLAGCGSDSGTGGGSAGSTSSSGGGDNGDAAQICVDTINEHRASAGLPAYARWTDAEDCSDGEAESDSSSGKAHGAFGTCMELAQNECPGWPGPPAQMIPSCLQMMWDEGPGDFNGHGHYLNMSSTSYKKVACGFFTLPNGSVWSVQNFK